MAKSRIRMMGIPEELVEEAEKIKKDIGFTVRADAFREMVKYSQIGRAFESGVSLGKVPKYDPKTKKRKNLMEQELF